MLTEYKTESACFYQLILSSNRCVILAHSSSLFGLESWIFFGAFWWTIFFSFYPQMLKFDLS